jgi:hypothetical protein
VKLKYETTMTWLAQDPVCADAVEKLDKNGELFFCRKAKHSELLSALTM